MFKNLFGGKKNEFFVELDESKAPKAEVPTSSEVAPAPAVKAEPVAATEKPASKKTSVKSKAKATPKVEAAPVKVAPAPVKVEPTEVKFATQTFAPSLSRRNPGPSLDKFKAMARESKSVR
jgi:hypothetical protein